MHWCPKVGIRAFIRQQKLASNVLCLRISVVDLLGTCNHTASPCICPDFSDQTSYGHVLLQDYAGSVLAPTIHSPGSHPCESNVLVHARSTACPLRHHEKE